MSLPHARIFSAQRRAASWGCNLPAPQGAGSSVQRGLLRKGSLQGSAALGWVAWAADPDGPQRRLRCSTSGPEAGAGRAAGGATVPARRAPGGPKEASSAGGRALLRVSRPSPPA